LRALKAGTRSSPLALIQTEEALLKLGARFGLAFETVPFSSPGDRDKASDLRASPPDFFTKDLDEALLDGRIDLAVHSAKDMPEQLPDGLDFLWLPWREDPRDVLVLREGAALPGPDAKLRIGVSSARREAYCRMRFPNAELLPIRGNIADRVAQLDAGRFDLLPMAAAGLARLGLQNRISEFVPLSELEPPPGQGVLAISFRKDEEALRKLRLAFVKTVVFAGAGPGPKELLTLASAEALKCCDACLYDSLIDESALSLLPSGAIAVAVGKRKGAHSFKQEDICRLLCDFARQGKAVTRLKGGDPGLFGRLAEETDALSSLGLPFRVIPGVSSLTAATSATGLLLTRRGVSRGFSAFTPRKANSGDFEAVSQKERAELPLAVFMGASETAKLCAQLIAEGKAASTPAALVLGAATHEMKILAGSLESLPAKAEAEASQLPGLLVIGEVAAEKHLFGSCGALASKRTLLVCSEILAEKAARAVRQFSGVPIHFNMTELQAQNGAIAKLASFEKIDWLLCSSPSSARILIEGLLKLGCDLRRLPKLLSCGPGTSEEFKKYGLLPDAQAEAPFGGEAILRCAAKHLEKGSRVLRVRSDAAGTSLGDGLQELGMELVDAPIYRSVPVKRERLPDFAFAFFSSSSEVESFAASFGGGPLAGKKAVAIGKPTQMALRALCPGAEVLAPEESTAEAAIAALAWSQVADMVCGFIP
jgi:uroporphyrinogen III methyltransferase/synthase